MSDVGQKPNLIGTATAQPGGDVTVQRGSLSIEAGGDVVQQGGATQVADAAASKQTPEEQQAALDAARKGTAPAADPAAPVEPAKPAAEKAPEVKPAEGTVPEGMEALIAELPPETLAKFEPFTVEYNATGRLTPEAITAAATAFGQPEAVVKAWVAGLDAQKALAATTAAQANAPTPEFLQQVSDTRAAVYEAAGGEAQFKALNEWAVTGLTAEENAAWTAAANTSPALAKMLTTQFMAKFNLAGGPSGGPRTIERGAGGATPEAASGGYTNQAEQNAAIRDPRFSKDPAYRATVERKITQSNFQARAAGFMGVEQG